MSDEQDNKSNTGMGFQSITKAVDAYQTFQEQLLLHGERFFVSDQELDDLRERFLDEQDGPQPLPVRALWYAQLAAEPEEG